MANDLRKSSRTEFAPEIKAQAAQPYRPARAAWTEVRTERLCEIVTTATGGMKEGPVKTVTWSGGKMTVTWEYVAPEAPTFKKTRVCKDVVVTIKHPAQPAQPAQEAIAYRPAGVVQNYKLGWNAGARSIEFLPESGYAEFRVQGVGVVVGFSAQPEGTLWTDIEHAFYATRRTLRIVESGVEKHAAGSFEPEDILRIERIGDRIEYRKNGLLLYKSQQPSTRPVYLDACLYSGGDTVSDPKLGTSDASNGSIHAAMQPMAGLLSDHPYAIFRAEMPPLVGMLSALRTRFHGVMRPLQGMFADRPYARLHGAMQPLTGRLATGLPPPDYALFAAQMYPMQATLHGITGAVFRSAAVMAPMATLWADRPYAAIHGEMSPAIGAFFDSSWTQRPAMRLPLPGLAAQSGASVELTGPRPQLRIEASDAANRAELVMGRPALHIETGAQVLLAAPAAQMQVEATVHAVARVELVCPMPALVVEAMVQGLAHVQLTAPAAHMHAVGGAQVQLLAPAAQLHIEAMVEGLAQVNLLCPMPRFTVQAQGEATAQVVLVAPAMIAAGWGEAVLRMPLARVVLQATVEVPVVHESYAVNLRTSLETGGNEVTRYTDFPFERIVRWRGRYVAMAADGLYWLGGDTDAGQPIAWRLHTGTTDFGSPQRKTPLSCYVGGRMPPDSTFEVAMGEARDTRYPYQTPRGSAAQNYRQKFGRGLDARYYAFALSGRGALTIDDLDFEVVNKTRRI